MLLVTFIETSIYYLESLTNLKRKSFLDLLFGNISLPLKIKCLLYKLVAFNLT